jgi:hypothetical protein
MIMTSCWRGRPKREQQLLARAIVCATDGGACCVCVHTLNYHEYFHFVVRVGRSSWLLDDAAPVVGGHCGRLAPTDLAKHAACTNSYQEVVIGTV